ncbi:MULTISPECIES: acetyl-CoA carboxylase biotin carboxylase subunit family protein [unclassified Fibrobacter]|uniref:ATP-grasp domain-containing protein n=1 Tax=unclassified Fibrobacter TaxID=2634177 RepID=UPI000D6AF43A|nr:MULTISPECIES: ATP-grasp domain-containing protein [unclassified Fibrobacter]PWJ63047.1 biotin carboxylase [Fibrobacter sp. UWR4]PZW68218.1 biotin carboxylase [Fibrobacter sp. UWR1]
MSKKKLLLLGGGHAEIPLIQAAQELGYFVITTGNAREGLGHPYADKNVFADFSDKDAMLALAREEGVSAVCSGCNDFALLSTVYVCEKLGLPGHDSLETSLQIHHKDKYRALAERLGIPTPRSRRVSVSHAESAPRHAEESQHQFLSLDEACAGLTFPLIVKPVDLTGGKGIHRVNNLDEAQAAYEDAVARTREDHIVVEEFVVGSNHGFSCFLKDGKVAFYFADNEQYYLNKYMVSGANTPSSTSQKGLNLLVEYSERIAADLHLVDGILHIQYIEQDDGIPVIIEICRRPPGDLYIKFVKYATGVDYPKMLIAAECGLDVSWILRCAQNDDSGKAQNDDSGKAQNDVKPFLRHCVMANHTGIVDGVDFAPEIQKNMVEKFLWYKEGDVVSDFFYYKAGIVFLQFESVQEMRSKTANMNNLIRIRMK